MSVSTKGSVQSESKLTENDEKISMIVNAKKIEKNICSETSCEEFREAEAVSFSLVKYQLTPNSLPV